MRPAVRDAFVAFSGPLEGVLGHLYCDVKGLVTTAIGVLVDPKSLAIGLPWLRKDGTRATPAEVDAEWERVKARQDWRLRGGRIYASVCELHLDEAGILHAVASKLNEMDHVLGVRFPGYASWCADAQLGMLSMAWALGPHFNFPRMALALRSRDFLLAAEECTISTAGNPGVKPRNERNRVLFRNAAVIERDGLDLDRLYWPRDLLSDAPTLPSLEAANDSEPLPIVRNNTEMIEELIKGHSANDDDPDAA
jgi:hypothetical protein